MLVWRRKALLPPEVVGYFGHIENEKDGGADGVAEDRPPTPRHQPLQTNREGPPGRVPMAAMGRSPGSLVDRQ